MRGIEVRGGWRVVGETPLKCLLRAAQLNFGWDWTGIQNDPGKFIPPERLRLQLSGSSDEKSGGNAFSFQNGAHDFQVITVTVIEGDRDGSLGKVLGLQAALQVPEGRDRRHAGQHVDLFGEELGGDTKAPWVGCLVGDAVVEQNQAGWSATAPDFGPGFGPESGQCQSRHDQDWARMQMETG